MNVRKLTPEERPRAEELFAIAFEQPLNRDSLKEPEPDTVRRWASFDANGNMTSKLVVTDFPIFFDGNTCKMGGIGGVASLPQYRRQGGIRGCFETMLPEIYRDGYDFSYLYPFSTCFYRQFGYENCVQKYSLTVDLSLLRPGSISGSWLLAEGGCDPVPQIRAVDTIWENKYNMAVRHTDDDYGWVAKLDPAALQEFCYIYLRADGTPGGYTVFRKQDQADGRNLVCSRFRFADRESFQALMCLFRSLAADHRYLKLSLPAEPAMQYMMPEWSLGAAQWHIAVSGMVRVVNVESVLKKAACRGSGQLTLQILDPIIPENNGCFTIRLQDRQVIRAKPDRQEPDAVLPISAFSALISGVCEFADAAAWFGELQIRNPNAPFSSLFYRKPLFIDDYF